MLLLACQLIFLPLTLDSDRGRTVIALHSPGNYSPLLTWINYDFSHNIRTISHYLILSFCLHRHLFKTLLICFLVYKIYDNQLLGYEESFWPQGLW